MRYIDFCKKGAKLSVYSLCTEDVWLVKEVCLSLMGLTETNKADFVIQDNKQPKYTILLFLGPLGIVFQNNKALEVCWP